MDNHDNKLSNSCEENPKLGHNHRYVKFLSDGLRASRRGLSSTYKSIKYYSIALKLKLSLVRKKGYKRKAGIFYLRAWKLNYYSSRLAHFGGYASGNMQCSSMQIIPVRCSKLLYCMVLSFSIQGTAVRWSRGKSSAA